MKRLPLFLLACAALLAARARADDEWNESRLLAAGLKHSDIVLMPEGTPDDYRLFGPLRPTVVAWGEDALPVLDGGNEAHAKFARKSEAYRGLGVRLLAANIWMLTATEHYLYRHPELLDATCVDLWGKRILPPWLADADFKGVKPWWGCTNNPKFKEQLLARMRAGLEAGATMIHLDDHSGTYACAQFAGGCFCEHCMRGFREWLTTNGNRDELAAAGVTDLAGFDYKAFLLKRGYPDRAAFAAASVGGKVPMWDRFLDYQREAAVEFVERMKAEAARIAGHTVPFGVNAYDLLPVQLFDAHAIDYFANEVEQFDKEDTVPPVVYRLGEALGRPVFATGTGEDWIKYRQSKATTRVRAWIAEAYAFGQFFMYSWNKWGFSKETGTQWTEIPPEVYLPMVEFVRENAPLFDGMENAAPVGLLYDNAAAAAGNWEVRDVSKALLDAGVSYELIVSGDALLRMPRDRVWPNKCRVLVRSMKEVDPPAMRGRIEVRGEGRVWALPRVNESGSRMVVHCLNRDYDASTDAMKAKTRLKVLFNPASLNGPAKVQSVRYYEPDAKSRELPFRQSADGNLEFDLPRLDIWGIVEIE